MKRAVLSILLLAVMLIGCAGTDVGRAETPALVETGVDPDAWILIPAGSFLMGQHEHEVEVNYDYEIMVTDVTTAQYAAYLNDALAAGAVTDIGDAIVGYYPGDVFRGHEHEEKIEAGEWLHVPLAESGLRLARDGETYAPLNGYANHPMVLVTWFGAVAYCEALGGRLPTEIEWEKAARGDDGRPFPWGDRIQPASANYYSSHDVFERVAGKLGDTTPVGFYSGATHDGFQTLNAVSPYGLYDMAGNVWQWVGDLYEGAHYRYLRGGSKADYAYNLRVWTRNSARPDYASPNVGFRCVRGGEG